MQMMLYMAHSGVRYLVLLAAVVAIVMAALNWNRTTGGGRGERIAASAFVGTLDLQILLGLILLTQRPWYSQMIGHLVMMVLAAVVAHTGQVLARRREPATSGSRLRVASVALALLLVIGGILALGRGVFESAGM